MNLKYTYQDVDIPIEKVAFAAVLNQLGGCTDHNVLWQLQELPLHF